MDVGLVLSRLDKVKQRKGYWVAQCPAHHDRHPSLKIREGTHRVFVDCFAGCSEDDIFGAIGVRVEDVKRIKGWSDDAIQKLGVVSDGDRVRFSNGVSYQPDPDKRLGSPKAIADKGPRTLYPDPSTIEGDTIWVVEGEPDSVSMHSIGLPAVGVPGASSWREEWATLFKRKKVIVCMDCDEPGRKLASRVAEDLKDIAYSVKVIDLDPTSSDGKDVGDYVSMGEGTQVRLWLEDVKERTPFKFKSGLRFRKMGEVRDSAKDTDWIWHGFLAKGSIAVLAGQPKVGKSTLVFGLMKALNAGESFLDLPVRKAGVLLLSEERDGSLAEKAEIFGVQDSHVLCRADVRGPDWVQIMDETVDYCEDYGIGVLVVDTFDKWGGHDENNPRDVVNALEPLIHAAGKGLAVLVVHHQRKSGGQYGEAVRGSNALTGGVDIVCELERTANVRVLRSVSRFRDTPSELMVALDEGRYSVVPLVSEAEMEFDPYTFLT